MFLFAFCLQLPRDCQLKRTSLLFSSTRHTAPAQQHKDTEEPLCLSLSPSLSVRLFLSLGLLPLLRCCGVIGCFPLQGLPAGQPKAQMFKFGFYAPAGAPEDEQQPNLATNDATQSCVGGAHDQHAPQAAQRIFGERGGEMSVDEASRAGGVCQVLVRCMCQVFSRAADLHKNHILFCAGYRDRR